MQISRGGEHVYGTGKQKTVEKVRDSFMDTDSNSVFCSNRLYKLDNRP